MSDALKQYVRFLRSSGAKFEIADDLVRDPDHVGSLLPDVVRPRIHGDLIERELLEWDQPARSLGSDHATLSTAGVLARMGAALNGKRFLDLGCGTGLFGILAAALGAQVVATDIDAEAIKLCKKNARLNDVQLDLRQGNLCDPITNDEIFDVVVMNLPQKPAPLRGHGLPLGNMGGPDGDTLLASAIPCVAANQREQGRLLFFLHSLPHPRILRLIESYYDLTLIVWKIRWFAADEFQELLPFFRERAASGTSFLWQDADREGLVAGIWQGTRKEAD